MLQLPLIIGLRQHAADQSDDGALVREHADDIGASFGLLAQTFEPVRAVKLGPVLNRKVSVRQHVGLALVDERRKLGPCAPERVGDMAQRLARRGAIGMDEAWRRAAATMVCWPFGT